MLLRWGTSACAGIAAIATLALLWQAVTFTGDRAPAAAVDHDNPANASAADDFYDRLNDRLGANNVFAEPDPEGFQGELTGILGDVALFDGDSARVGERVSGATVTAIGPDWAEIEFNGETKRMWVFEERDTPEEDDDADRTARPRRADAPREATGASRPATRQRTDGTGREIHRLRERLGEMNPEQREQMIDRLPPHIAAQLE